MMNRNNLNQMKKALKKGLIVDQFEQIKRPPPQPNPNSTLPPRKQGGVRVKVQEVACRTCGRYVSQEEWDQHERQCQVQSQINDYCQMFYNRKPHCKQWEQRQEESIRRERMNDDYYPEQEKPSYISKPKRPNSAMNKKQTKPKVQQPKQGKLKKAISTSKFKEEPKKSYHPSKEKGQKSKGQTKFEHIYLKGGNGVQKKHTLSIGNGSKLKKKSTNAPHRFISSQQHSIEEKQQRIASRSKKEERMKESYRFQEDDRQRRAQPQQRLKSQMTTQKLKQTVREKLRQEQEREKRQQPKRETTQRQPIRTEVRQERERQPRQLRQPRQPRPQRQQRRRQTRNPMFQRYPRRNQQRGQLGPSIMHMVSETINNQLQMMNNQFSVMANIFQNFNSFVNINIGPHPNYFQFNTHEMNTSSEYDSDSHSNSYSSDYDDYNSSEPEGMDEDQINAIQNKMYRGQQGQNQCTICLVELKQGDVIKQLYCDHMFHSECIEEWLKRKSACPVCRDQLA